MSHSSGAVRFSSGIIKHVEYNGTSDVLQPKMFNTYDEMQANWRTTDWPTCKCENLEPIDIAVTYGGGFEWKGFACRKHNCVRTLDPHTDSQSDGLPDWYPNEYE